ncbi:hypothetical protein NC653_028818 [Populus alba x Populus x berolinensis]|uniref:Uncharacterized protein n=1 Tax=Populus alba x Populus x berolinensis TaxID=444605 RepID=A0AAD6M0W9_9ROSI|nr:hypothetical protein NC653_028818 [Populus alba x Populus x berolinensis]
MRQGHGERVQTAAYGMGLPVLEMMLLLKSMSLFSICYPQEHIYFSSDSICSPSGDAENLNIVHPPEFLRNLQLNGIPPTQIIFESRSSHSVIEESS